MARKKTKRRPASGARQWMPLMPAERKPKTAEQIEALVRDTMALLDCDEATARDAVEDNMLRPQEMFLNDQYVVFIDRNPEIAVEGMEGMIHLSIRRQDRKAVRDWRDFQRIKNELVGAEREAVELYPAESRVVDTANQFHLWVLPEGAIVPIGWFGMRLVGDAPDALTGARQRAL